MTKLILLASILLCGCGDNLPGDPMPDAGVVQPDSAYWQPACATAPHENYSCHPTVPGAFCPTTITLGSYRGCCLPTDHGIDFFPCE